MVDDIPNLNERARIATIISVALIMGVLTFTLVSLVLVHVIQITDDAEGALISTVIAGLSILNLVLAYVLPVNVKLKTDNPTVEQAANEFQTRSLIRFAVLEGACFMNIVAYILEHQWWSLAIVGGCLMVMLTVFPTRTKFKQYVETRTAFSFDS